jgi:hypothetical protein
MERDSAREDARHVAMDAATAAAKHQPELEAAHADNSLPEWFDQLLNRCILDAHDDAREALRVRCDL